MEPTRGGAFKGVPPRLLYKLLLGSRLNNTDIVATINVMAEASGHLSPLEWPELTTGALKEWSQR
jgi:hypothetical protein